MGESIAEGTLSKWLKKVGDPVKRDEPIFEISTDKVDAEIPAPTAGVLAEILVTEGQTVPVQTVVARLETDVTAAVAAPAVAPSAPAAATAPYGAQALRLAPLPHRASSGRKRRAPLPAPTARAPRRAAPGRARAARRSARAPPEPPRSSARLARSWSHVLDARTETAVRERDVDACPRRDVARRSDEAAGFRPDDRVPSSECLHR